MKNYIFKVKNIKHLKKELRIIKKKCTRCNNLKKITDYYRCNKNIGGRDNQCKECRRKKYKHTCEICGKKYINDKKNSKYCSVKCRTESRKNKITYFCDFCGKECEQIPAEYNSYKNHYCSSECKNKHQGQIYSMENHPQYSQVKYNCDNCGAECSMKKSHYEARTHHFCSSKCMGEWYSENRIGENHPRWNPDLTEEERNDRRKYPEYTEWRNKVFERDNYTCIISGVKGEIEAHHLNAYKWDKEHRTDIDNGVTISVELHKEFHKKYGKGNNTLEDFKEFYKDKTGKDFKIN